MSSEDLLTLLQQLQYSIIDIAMGVPEHDYRTQYHPDLSPLGWHLGHCVFTEIYWLREVLLGEPAQNSLLTSFYVPELSPKTCRGNKLPPRDDMCRWAEQNQRKNLALLRQLMNDDLDHELMREGFLINFLVQHYAQHHETIHYILTQRELRASNGFKVNEPLLPDTGDIETVAIDGGRCCIGAGEINTPYDNEHPCFELEHDGFLIARRPITNGQYLAFMDSGGYTNDAFWNDDGRRWKSDNSIDHPDHWHEDAAGNWYGHDADGPEPLSAHEPVYGVSYYEAEAYARWAGGRLAHEHEWEIASLNEKLEQTGAVWEWNGNTFYPYEGFKAFPYVGYSVPYFDDRHFTLKGGSRYTHGIIKRRTFRNYFEPEKRHHYAGIRLACDQP